MRPLLRGFGIGVGLVFASIGCRQIVGFDWETPPSHDAGDAGIDAEAGAYVSSSAHWPFADPECGACIDHSCAMEARSCALDPSCQARGECVAACPRGVTACADRCIGRVPSAVLSPEMWPLSHCVAAHCSMECPSSVVTASNGETCGPLRGKFECTRCCCKEFETCNEDSECRRQSACARQCSPVNSDGAFDQACFEACTGIKSDHLDPNVDLAACAKSSLCAGSCRSVDWTCLGNVWPPKPSSGARRLYGSVRTNAGDFSSSTPLRGFHVKMCPVLGAMNAQSSSGVDLCPMSLQEEVSNELGDVVLDLNRIGGTEESPQWGIYFEVTAPSGLDYPKYLFFLPPWTLTHSLHKNFFVFARDSFIQLPPSDPGQGGVVFSAHDCSQVLHTADGVEVTALPAGKTIYSGLLQEPDPNAQSTSSTGIGVITNLPAGQVTLSTRRHGTGEFIGTTIVVIESGATTMVDLAPTPPSP